MDAPGITRDTVKIPTKFYGRDIVLMDTAGLRRKAGVTDDVETLYYVYILLSRFVYIFNITISIFFIIAILNIMLMNVKNGVG